MNLLEIAVALTQIEERDDAMRSSVELLWALFKRDLTEAEQDTLRIEIDVSPAWLQDIRECGDAITSAGMSVLAVHDPDAFTERLPEQLLKLTEQITTSDDPDDSEALFVAAHLQTSRLAFYLLQSADGQDGQLFEYGKDTARYMQLLERLIDRLRRSMPRRGSPCELPEVFQMSVSTIESLAEHVEAALAEQRGEYAEALAHLANSLEYAALMSEINEAWEESENPEELVDLARACPWRAFRRAVDSGSWFSWTLPWLSAPELQRAAGWFKALRSQPGKHDWAELTDTFATMLDVGPEDVEVDGCTWDIYWNRAESWAENESTPEKRLRKYFTDGQWETLPEDARNALISAERTWISSKNQAEALDHIQIAIEVVLHSYFCEPFLKWVDEHPNQAFPESEGIRRATGRGDRPMLRTYEKIFNSDGGIKHLRERLVKGSDACFVKDAREHFERLRKARNSERHTTKSLSASELRDIYAEFMGLGRNRCAILPELVRILSQPSL